MLKAHRIYIASSWKNQLAVILLAAILEREGFEVDAFCRATDKRFSFHWSELVDNEADLQKYDAISFLGEPKSLKAYNEDKKWLDWADTVIMFMPCGYSSHIEAGYAKGSGKTLYIFGEFQKGKFEVMYRFADNLYRLTQLEALIASLKGQPFC